jgi:hypothetical protein
VSIAGVVAWGAGVAAFYAAGSTIGGTLPALGASIAVYLALRYTLRR